MAANVVVFARISWLSLLVVVVIAYVLILIGRGIRDLVAWLYDLLVARPEREKRWQEIREQRRKDKEQSQE